MIFTQDNYLPLDVFKKLQDYCSESHFEIIKAGGKEFSTLETPKEITPYLEADGYNLILTFIRYAHHGFDNDLNIHADNIILNKKTSMASVLYINEDNIGANGTSFFEHHHHGVKLPEDCSSEEFDRLLTEDSEDIGKWKLADNIKSRPNRLLMYNANYFHAKYPKEITLGKRIVLVCFYEKSK